MVSIKIKTNRLYKILPSDTKNQLNLPDVGKCVDGRMYGGVFLAKDNLTEVFLFDDELEELPPLYLDILKKSVYGED